MQPRRCLGLLPWLLLQVCVVILLVVHPTASNRRLMRAPTVALCGWRAQRLRRNRPVNKH